MALQTFSQFRYKLLTSHKITFLRLESVISYVNGTKRRNLRFSVADEKRNATTTL